MASAWPTVADVQNVLRLQPDGAGDDLLVSQDLAGAIDWAIQNINPKHNPADPTYIGVLGDGLFSAVQHYAARLYRRRDSVDGTIGWGDMGIVRVGGNDPDPNRLIGPYLAIVIG